MFDDERPMDRRRFFREGLRGLLRPISKAVKPLENVAHQIGKLDPPPPPVIKPPSSTVSRQSLPIVSDETWVRPPGALNEEAFRNTCTRCGECVRVCPVQAIRIDSGYLGFGYPYIDADRMACVLCDGLLCMSACPSGALISLPRDQIDIGTAVLNDLTCLRSAGQDCTICVDHCPVGPTALTLENSRVKVLAEGCTGCGVCQHDCPTLPKSIVIQPKAQRDATS